MAMFMLVAAAVVGVVSAVQKGKQEEQQYKAQQQVAEYNARATQQRADTIRTVTTQKIGQVNAAYGEREAQQRRDATLQAGRRRAAIAQSGTGLGGSNMDVDNQSHVLAEMDALNIRYEGALTAHDIQIQGDMQATDMDTQSQLYSYDGQLAGLNASNARRNMYLSAVGAGLKGASNVMAGGMGGGGGGYGTGAGNAPSTYGLYGNYRAVG